MQITILKGVENASKAEGLTVVIDVFRAYTTACYLINSGAEKIIIVETTQKALELKKYNTEYILCGERQGYKPEGFDFGNSPSEIVDVDLKGKTVVLTTSLGTLGLINAKNSSEKITASFVNLASVADYIKKRDISKLSIICTSSFHKNSKDEDYVCAVLLSKLITGEKINFNNEIKMLIKRGYAKPFFDPNFKSHPKEDFDLCTELNKFKFVLRASESIEGSQQLYIVK
jgi:2-phosphosulfolactate phosphatase